MEEKKGKRIKTEKRGANPLPFRGGGEGGKGLSCASLLFFLSANFAARRKRKRRKEERKMEIFRYCL